MFQIGALYLILTGIIEELSLTKIIYALILLLAGVVGKVICNYISDFSQTKVGYFMCADKRIHVGDRMKYMPMGYFNSHSLGYITSTVTTIIGDVENNAPSVLITVIHGFIHVCVITLLVTIFDWRIGLICMVGIIAFLFCNSVMQKITACVPETTSCSRRIGRCYFRIHSRNEYCEILQFGERRKYENEKGHRGKLCSQYKTRNSICSLWSSAAICITPCKYGNHVDFFVFLLKWKHDINLLFDDVCCFFPNF